MNLQRPIVRFAGTLAALLSLSPAVSPAATITWDGATNTLNTASNWVGGTAPISNDSVVFAAPGAGGLLLNNNLTSGSFNVAGVTFLPDAGAYVIGNGTTSANSGNSFVLTGSVFQGSINSQSVNTPISLGSAVRTFTTQSLGSDLTLGGNLSTNNGGISKSGLGTLTLSGANTYTGATTLVMGVLRLNGATSLPGGIGSSGGTSALVFNGANNTNINGGVLGLAQGNFTRPLASGGTGVVFTGNGGWAAFGADRTVNLGGASAPVTWATATTGLNAKVLILGHPSATHMVDLQNPLDLGSAARTIQVDRGSGAIDGKLSGNLTGVSGGNLSKFGNGILLLTGANSYAGTTTVSGGLLQVNGTHTGGGNYTISSGAALGGTGTISSAVTASAGGNLNLRDGLVGNLSLGSALTLSGTVASPNNLVFDLGNDAAGTDKIVVTGAHSAPTATGVRVHLNQLPGTPVTPGPYTLIQGGAASTFTGYVLATTRAGGNLYSALGANGNNLQVTVAAGDAGPANSFAYWKGSTSVWNTAQWFSDDAGTVTSAAPGFSSNVRFATTTTPSNLTQTLGQDYEINSLTVDAGLAAVTVNGTSNTLALAATSANGNAVGNGLTINNSAGTNIATRVGLESSQTWTVGSGATLTVSGVVSDFGGGHALIKTGDGTLTFSGANTWNGPLTISAGNVTVSGTGSLASSRIINNGTLTYNISANQTFIGPISGTGALVKAGTGILSLTQGYSGSGGITINGGTLGGITPLVFNPFGSGTVTVNTGGTVQLNRNDLNTPLVFNGGTLNAGNSFPSTVMGPVTLAATSTLSITGGLVISGPIGGPGGLTKIGASIITLSGNNSFGGPVTINAGGFIIASFNSVLGGTTTSGLGSPATLADGTISLGSTTTGATLVYTGNGETTDRVLKLAGTTGGATFNQSGPRSSLLKFTSNLVIPGSGSGDNRKTLTLAAHGSSGTINNSIGAVSGSGEISGNIGDSLVGASGQTATSITKTGFNTWTLSGTNTYTGTTTVAYGTLAITGSNALGNGPLAISTGAKLSLDFHGTRAVSELKLNNVAQSNGTFGSTESPATFKNDTYFSGPGTVTVGPTGSSATTFALTGGTNPSNGGAPVTFTATVTGSSPSGSVAFYDGLTPLGTSALNGSGQATFSTSLLGGGSHALTAVYLGDGGNSFSASAALSQTVTETRGASTTTLSLSGGTNPSAYGASVTLQATVTGTSPSGNVALYDGTTVIGSAPLNGSGQASFSTTGLRSGPHSLSARYLGDTANAPSASTTPYFLNVNPPTGNGKLKVFLLAGQSNMQGKGRVEAGRDPSNYSNTSFIGGYGSLRNMLNKAPEKYGFLADPANPTPQGNPGWLTRSDVWVSYWSDPFTGGQNRNGALDPYFGNNGEGPSGGDGRHGPEYAFGLTMGNRFGDQVLLIKYAFGGKSLAVDFRPPGAVAARGGVVGPFYTGMVSRMNQVLGNLSTYYPAYSGGGYELAGFAWHQGYNDRGNTTYEAEYEANMTNLIKDLRTEFNAPTMPVVIANTGMANAPYGPASLVEAQGFVANPTRHPEFAGNVTTVDTRPFDYGEALGGSTEGYHWFWNSESYFYIGESMGQAMLALLPAVPSGGKDIVSMDFPGLGTPSLNLTNLSLSVPSGTVLTALAPVFTLSAGATASPPSGTARDFSSPQSYTITAADGSSQNYLVTVTVATTNTYAAWSAGPFAGTLGNTASEVDFDGGSLPTGIERVVGGDPTTPADDAALTPTLNSADPADFVFSFRRSDAAQSDPATIITVQYGLALETNGWSTATHGVNGVTIDDSAVPAVGFHTVVVRLPKALATEGKLFTRLRVETTP